MAVTSLKTKYTAEKSDFLEATANYQAETDAITYWEQLLQPAETTLQSSVQTANIQAGYDITNAYKNYLQQQESVENSALLGTSKNLLSSQLKNQYAGSYTEAQSALASSLSSAYEQYYKDYESAYKTLESEASTLKSLQESLLDYIEQDYEALGYSKNDINNMYALNTTTGQYELTDTGKAIYQSALESTQLLDEESDYRANKYINQLKEQDSDLYDYYMNNKDKVKSLLAGYTGTADYETDSYNAKISEDKKEKGSNLYGIDANFKDEASLLLGSDSAFGQDEFGYKTSNKSQKYHDVTLKSGETLKAYYMSGANAEGYSGYVYNFLKTKTDVGSYSDFKNTLIKLDSGDVLKYDDYYIIKSPKNLYYLASEKEIDTDAVKFLKNK